MFKRKEPGSYCPLIKKNCIENECSWYIHIRGTNPNTGEDVDHWGCSVSWIPTLLIENSQQQRSTGAAVESFRNEVVRANDKNLKIYFDQFNKYGVIPATITPLTNLLDQGEISDETNNNSN